MVDTAEYGEFQHYAWDTEAWERLRAGRENGDRDRARAEESAEAPGSILFAAVPDEEAFSAGMRGAVPLFAELAGRYGLEYGGFMDLEPCALEPCAVAEETDSQRVYIGSVGKLMPAVLVQGAKAHVAEAFRGMNALGLLSDFMLRTELDPAFAETWEGEVCMPPTWLHMRDRKAGYDVSVPQRAQGYLSVLSFSRDAEAVMG